MKFNKKRYSVLRAVYKDGKARDFQFSGLAESYSIFCNLEGDIERVEVGKKDENGNYFFLRVPKYSTYVKKVKERVIKEKTVKLAPESKETITATDKSLNTVFISYIRYKPGRRYCLMIYPDKGMRPTRIMLREGIAACESIILDCLKNNTNMGGFKKIIYGFCEKREFKELLTINSKSNE